jgi:hypothetical protein
MTRTSIGRQQTISTNLKKSVSFRRSFAADFYEPCVSPLSQMFTAKFRQEKHLRFISVGICVLPRAS